MSAMDTFATPLAGRVADAVMPARDPLSDLETPLPSQIRMKKEALAAAEGRGSAFWFGGVLIGGIVAASLIQGGRRNVTPKP